MAAEEGKTPTPTPVVTVSDATAMAEKLEEALKYSQKKYEYLLKDIELLKKEVELVQKTAEITGDQTSVLQKQNELKKLTLEEEAARLLKTKEITDLTTKELERLVEIAEQVKEIERTQKEIAGAKAKGGELAKLLGIDENNKNSLTYRLFSQPKAFFQGFTDQVKEAGGITQALTAGIVNAIENQTKKAFFAYDNAASSLAKIAGSNEQMQKVLADTARGATQYGISFEQAGKAIEGLYTELNTFTTLSQAAQEQLVISTAKLDRLGISSQQSAKQIGTLTQIMGMTEVQAGKTSEQLAGFALSIGKSPQQIATDFAAASNSLAAYGKDMVDVFKNLEVQSKATGVAVSDLVRIAEKFQTFEGAASSAGKLNAALGGGFVNAMELLEASAEDPSKAIDLLRTRLNDAGLAFDQMSFYEKKMIADAAGFKSVEEASRILSMNNAEAERAAKGAAERANQQKLVNEAVERSIPIQQKLEMLMANFAIVMRPVVEIISGFISGLAWVIDNVPGLNYILMILVGIFGSMMVLGQIVALFRSSAAALGLFNTVAAATAPAATPAAGSLTTLGTSAAAAAPGLVALGGGLFSVLGPIALLVGSVALLVASFALLAYGVGYVVGKFVELFTVITNLGPNTKSLILLSSSMLLFANPAAMAGMLAFASGLMAIAIALKLMPDSTVIAFSAVTEHIAKIATVEKGNTAFGKQTKEMIDAINDFDLGSSQVESLERILKSINSQQQTQQQINVQPPQVKVFVGTKEIKDVVIQTNNGGSIIPAEALMPITTTR
jgi:hypothetical protein